MAKAISKAIPKFGSENVAPIKHSFMRIFNFFNLVKVFNSYRRFRMLWWHRKEVIGPDGSEGLEGP